MAHDRSDDRKKRAAEKWFRDKDPRIEWDEQEKRAHAQRVIKEDATKKAADAERRKKENE